MDTLLPEVIMKILLVEDDMEISVMLKNFSMTENFEVVTVFDGESACKEFFSDTFDLVLLDLMIPKMSGMEVMEKIRECSTVPVIIVSAKDTDSDKTLGLGLGADDSSHLLSEIESIADTIGIISRGQLLREVSMQEIAEMNAACIEISVDDTKKAAYILSDKMNLHNFKVMDHSGIRIYDMSAETQKIARELLLGGVELASVTKHTQSLEDYFLKLTGEEERSC